MSDSDILAQLQGLRRRLPEPPRLARVELGQRALALLKAISHPEGAPAETSWRLPGTSVGVPIVLRDDMDPGAWRLIGRHGEVIDEGTLTPALRALVEEQTGPCPETTVGLLGNASGPPLRHHCVRELHEDDKHRCRCQLGWTPIADWPADWGTPIPCEEQTALDREEANGG